MDEEHYSAVSELIREKMEPDMYGITTVQNIYYDTDDFRLIRRSLEQPVYKEKLRLRSYGIPGERSTVFLEIKKKFDGVVYKRRIPLTLKKAEKYLRYGVIPSVSDEHQQIMNEIAYFMHLYKPTAKLFLAYERYALLSESEPSLRVTFDSNIRSRTDELSLAGGSRGELLFPDNRYIMEIKAENSIPMWLTGIISRTGVRKTRFSKYGMIYMNGLWKTSPLFAEKPDCGTSCASEDITAGSSAK